MATSRDDDIIRVGDMVVVVHWFSCGCCLGTLRTVKEIWPNERMKYAGVHCRRHKQRLSAEEVPVLVFEEEHPWAARLPWCRKIRKVGDDEQTEEKRRFVVDPRSARERMAQLLIERGLLPDEFLK